MGVQTIVVGVDLSERSEPTCRHALRIARRTHARIVLVHATALPELPEGLPASMQDTAAAYLGILRARAAEAERELAALATRLDDGTVTISYRLIDGFPDDGLVHAADEHGAGLIVTSGPIAERVVRTAHQPVLVARGPAAAGDTYRTICVATDFTEAAEHGVDLALALAADDARIDVIHFWAAPPVPRGHATHEADDTVEEIRAGMVLHGNERGAATIAARGDAGARLRYLLREGDPTEGIAEYAAAEGCDLVVVGSHGRRGLRRLLLGSVAEATVRHAPCSVLVAR